MLLRARGITKSFGRLVANDDISLEVRAGEVHALLGENGAGKSTLMKVLYGLLQPDRGDIVVEGRPVSLPSPRAAMDLGIGMVHQHFTLIPTFTAVQNVVLGLRPSRPPLLDLEAARRRLASLSIEYGLNVNATVPVEQLSIGDQQRLEILKALFRDARILLLDEPTAVLAPAEVRQLFRIVRRFRDEGRAVVFISHKLDEVKEVSDRVTVLRDGRVIGTVPTAEAVPRNLANMMVGRPVSLGRRSPSAPGSRPVLVADAVSCLSDRGTPSLRALSLVVNEGEILGVAGVDGNGQRELAECLSGMRPLESGVITVAGRPLEEVRPEDRRLRGFIPDDRRLGLILDFPISENAVMKEFRRPPFSRLGFLRWRRILEQGRRLIERLRMHRVGPRTPVDHLSGGNQQRVMVGREIMGDPSLIVAAQPTRGLDIGAVEDVHGMLLEQRRRGAAILFISSELDEVLALSDRVVVLFKGQVMGEVRPDESSVEEVGEMMLGERRRPGQNAEEDVGGGSPGG